MAITVGGTSITFNDGTTQTTAAGGAPTTAQVLSATAGASAGAVGTYGYFTMAAYYTLSPGSTISGSNMRYSAGGGYWYSGNNTFYYSSGTPSGTWMVLGYPTNASCGYYYQNATVCLRIA